MRHTAYGKSYILQKKIMKSLYINPNAQNKNAALNKVKWKKLIEILKKADPKKEVIINK